MDNLLQVCGLLFSNACQEARIHSCRCGDHGFGNRRQHCDLQPGPRRPASSLAVFTSQNRLVMVWEDASFIGFLATRPRLQTTPTGKRVTRSSRTWQPSPRAASNLTGDGEPERVQAYGVSAEFFPLLGVHTGAGRVFLPEEDKPRQTGWLHQLQTLAEPVRRRARHYWSGHPAQQR